MTGCAHSQPDADLAAFEANLAAHASATEALRQWCQQRGIADPAEIIAVQVSGADMAPPADIHALLGVSSDEPLGYRHVRLTCGSRVLSDAHNWYVPARLTAEMNRQLAETQVPFGRIAASLAFTREPLASARRGDPACPTGAISTHHALLRLPDGQPLATVVECYTEANLTR
ncbi:MAG: chorismate--pyruvate lyase family protein [Novosphingobium sp.]